MTRTPTRSSNQLAAIAQGAPFVIATRLMEAGQAGPWPSAQQQLEFSRMVSEKCWAAMEGWWAMAGAAWLAPWSGASMSAAYSPWSTAWQRWAAATDAGDRILAAGLRPTTRAVSANRSRLGRRSRS